MVNTKKGSVPQTLHKQGNDDERGTRLAVTTFGVEEEPRTALI
jgi:hypothetical protein